MKIKTNTLTGSSLNWAVGISDNRQDLRVTHGSVMSYRKPLPPKRKVIPRFYEPSTNWGQGGPIIERERICPTYCCMTDDWQASRYVGPSHLKTGRTPLIAAMRCFVASKLGEEVEIPDSLIDQQIEGEQK
jgi:hypothetical protein